MVDLSRILACFTLNISLIHLLFSIITGNMCLVNLAPEVLNGVPSLPLDNITLSDLYNFQLRLEQLAKDVEDQIQVRESQEAFYVSPESSENNETFSSTSSEVLEIESTEEFRRLGKRSLSTEEEILANTSTSVFAPNPTKENEEVTDPPTVSPTSEAPPSHISVEAVRQTTITESTLSNATTATSKSTTTAKSSSSMPLNVTVVSTTTSSKPSPTRSTSTVQPSTTPEYRDPHSPHHPLRAPIGRFGRFPNKTPPPECQRLSQDELVKELKERGTYNPDFMAWDVPGVIRFLEKASTTTNYDKEPEVRRQEDENLVVEKNIATLERVMKELDVQCDLRTSEVLQKIHNFTTSRDSPSGDVDRLRTIRQVPYGKGMFDLYARNKYLYDLYRSPSGDRLRDEVIGSSSQPIEDVELGVDGNSVEETNIVGKVHLVPFGCSKRGSSEDGYLRLCGACQAIRKLPDDFFPPFINEVLCDVDKACLYFYDYPHGKCKQKHMNFVVLRNLGTRDCQIWERFNLNVRVSCECFVDEMSFFAKYV